MNTSYVLTGLAFVVVTVVFFSLLVKYLTRALSLTGWDADRQALIRRRTIIALIGWAAFSILLAASGFGSNFNIFPVNAAPFLVIPLVTIIVVISSAKTRHILQFVPERTIILLQTFRFFVEVLLWLLVIQNLAPVQMSFEGRNFDILVALTAPLAAWMFAGKKWALVAWNIAGLCLLINIVTIAILSMPTPMRMFANEPANTIVLKAPFILLPAMLVPLAYGLHFLSLRQLLTKNSLVSKAGLVNS